MIVMREFSYTANGDAVYRGSVSITSDRELGVSSGSLMPGMLDPATGEVMNPRREVVTPPFSEELLLQMRDYYATQTFVSWEPSFVDGFPADKYKWKTVNGIMPSEYFE